jgi:diacylglycerol kinase (ATP)
VKVSFILNSSKRKAREIARKINNYHTELDWEIVETERPGHAIELASLASANDRLVVAVGGDGTVNECVNGLMRSPNPRLAVLPIGTGNDLVRSIEQARDIDQLFTLLQDARFRKVDVVKISSGEDFEYAMNIVDAGIGSQAVINLNAMPSWMGPKMKYTCAIVKTLLSAKNIEMECVSADWSWSGKAKLIAAANGKYFGGGLAIAPDADPCDGLLDVTIVGDIGLWEYVKQVGKLRKGEKLQIPEVKYFKAEWIELKGACQMEKDGELSMHLPSRLEIIPGALSILDLH